MPILAYHLTWTCYGQWLHGDERGCVDRDHRTPGTPYAPADPQRLSAAANAMAERPCWLTEAQRHLVAEGVREACAGQGWRLAALNVQPDHVHALVEAPAVTGKHAMRVLKTFATRSLRATASRERWWTKGGKVDLVRDARHLAAVARYIADQPFDAVSWAAARGASSRANVPATGGRGSKSRVRRSSRPPGRPGTRGAANASRAARKEASTMATRPVRLGVLLSGSGRTLENILQEIAGGALAGLAEVAVVIASRPGIRGIDIGREAGVPVHLVRRKEFPSTEAYSDAMVRLLDEARADLVCLAGFLSYWILPDRYLGRVMNIHPALLPSFGGHGMYGHHVHEAVLRRGCKVSGCTVHFVDNVYDEGPIILQRTVPAYADDTPDTLAARVFREECIAYPEAIRLYAHGRLRLQGRIVHVDDPDHTRP